MSDLTEDEAVVATADPRQVADIVAAIAATEGVILTEADIWNW